VRPEEQVAKPFLRLVAGGVVRDLQRPDRSTPLVDHDGAGRAEHHVRLLIEHFDTAREEGGCTEVVAGNPLEVLAPGNIREAAEVPCRAPVHLATEVRDPSIGAEVPAADLRSRIGRRVVTDDQLEVGEVLGKDRLDCLGKERLPVVHGKADAYPGTTVGHR
jgi:hypothetical protein